MSAYVIAATGFAACAALVAVYGPTLQCAHLVAAVALLAYASWTDVRSRVIPNACVAALAVLRLAYLALVWALGLVPLVQIGLYLASGIGIGVVLVALVALLTRLNGSAGMGGGDLKLYAVAGLYVGFQQALLVVVASCALGAVVGVFMAWRGRRRSKHEPAGVLKQTFPLGPAISLCLAGALIAEALLR